MLLREVSSQVLNARVTVSDTIIANGPIQQSPVNVGNNNVCTKTDSVTIGFNLKNLGANSISLGINSVSAFPNTICINADPGTTVTPGQASSLFINPVRGMPSPGYPQLYYNPTSHEIVYGI